MPMEIERLKFLASVVEREAKHLESTAARLFQGRQVTESEVNQWIGSLDLSERLDAFVARFGRLQDTIGDKLIPQLLAFLGERIGPAMDNLDKAERFGWISSADDWMAHRKLRNQMIHEYIDDPAVLAAALDAGRRWVAPMSQSALKLAEEVRHRLGDFHT